MAGKRAVVLAREWLPLEYALRSLGKSERSLQRLAAAGQVRWHFEGGTRRRLYHAGDLERVKEEGIPAGREEPQRVTAPRGAVAALADPETRGFLENLVARVTAPRIGIAQKLWLSLEEAQAYSGLSRTRLLALCRAGRLVAMRDRGWRIRRASLEAFAGDEPDAGPEIEAAIERAKNFAQRARHWREKQGPEGG